MNAPEQILIIKNNSSATPVKFFLSIEGHPGFPFAVTSADQSNWVKNATESLGKIIQDYLIDGVDVYYEHIKPEAVPQFADAIKQVVWNLKNGESPSSPISAHVALKFAAHVGQSYPSSLHCSSSPLFTFIGHGLSLWRHQSSSAPSLLRR